MEWEVLGVLGGGTFAQVHKVRDRSTGEIFALKTLHATSDADATTAQIEIEALRTVCMHPNIVRMISCKTTASEVNILLEFLGGGHVGSYTPMTEMGIAVICRDVLRGLSHIHEHGYVHRDVKASNVLLTTSLDAAKLIDLGVCGSLEGGCHTIVGSPHWMAPEVILCSSDATGDGYNEAADVWSLGILAIELRTGSAPWRDVPPFQVFDKIVNAPSPTVPREYDPSPMYLDFVRLCCLKNPSERPTSKALLGHSFILTAGERRPVDVLPPPEKGITHSLPSGDLAAGQGGAHHTYATVANLPEEVAKTILYESLNSLQQRYSDTDAMTVHILMSALREAHRKCSGTCKEILCAIVNHEGGGPTTGARTTPRPPPTASLNITLQGSASSSAGRASSSFRNPSHSAAMVAALPEMPEVGPTLDLAATLYNRWRKNVMLRERDMLGR